MINCRWRSPETDRMHDAEAEDALQKTKASSASHRILDDATEKSPLPMLIEGETLERFQLRCEEK